MACGRPSRKTSEVAKGFTRRGRGAALRYAARLDEHERELLVTLFGQVRDLIAPVGSDAPRPASAAPSKPTGTVESDDPFDAIVAGLGSDFGAAEMTSAPDELGGRGFGAQERDSAIDRLFPAANRTDEAAAREFRRLTEDSLRARKIAGLDAATAALRGSADDRLELPHEVALTFLVALTDVRLVLGDRLGLREDADAQRLQDLAELADPGDPAAYAVMVYDFLTWLQETLATSMLRRA